MSDDSVSFSQAALTEILQTLENRSEWELKPQFDSVTAELDPILTADRSNGELFFTHTTTDAQLSVRYPEQFSDTLVTILLEYPLDSRFPPGEGGFIGRVYQTQEAIADQYASSYLHGEQSPSVIAKAQIPERYDQSELTATIESLDTVAEKISQAHADLDAVLQTYRARQGDPSDR